MTDFTDSRGRKISVLCDLDGTQYYPSNGFAGPSNYNPSPQTPESRRSFSTDSRPDSHHGSHPDSPFFGSHFGSSSRSSYGTLPTQYPTTPRDDSIHRRSSTASQQSDIPPLSEFLRGAFSHAPDAMPEAMPRMYLGNNRPAAAPAWSPAPATRAAPAVTISREAQIAVATLPVSVLANITTLPSPVAPATLSAPVAPATPATPAAPAAPASKKAASKKSVSKTPASEKAASKNEKKRYPCREAEKYQCTKTFTTSGHASRHIKCHTGVKNIQCTVEGCLKTFSRLDNMQQHRLIHDKQSRRSTTRQASPPTQQPQASSSGQSGMELLALAATHVLSLSQ